VKIIKTIARPRVTSKLPTLIDFIVFLSITDDETMIVSSGFLQFQI